MSPRIWPGQTRPSAKTLAAIVLVPLVLLASPSRALAQPATFSGTAVYTFGSSLGQDESVYTLYYSVPQVIHAGVETNMTFYVYVTLLSGWKIQSQTQILQIIVNTPTRQVITQQTQNEVTLYQGARWGPFNMTFDLNDSQAGLSPGQVVNATVFAGLVVYEAYDNPASPFVQDSGTTMTLASVDIAASQGAPAGSPARALSSLAVGAAVVAVLAGVVLSTRSKKSRAEEV